VAVAVVPAAASALLGSLLDASGRRRVALVEVARTRSSVHYETGRTDLPVLCVCLPSAVRLPNALVARALPTGEAVALGGSVTTRDGTWQVRRWWAPPRPRGLTPPATGPVPGLEVAREVRPHDLLGAGPGLTPSGDDVLAGALVAAHATADPRLSRWRNETRHALRTRGTTAVSRGLLLHAVDGWATPELADFVTAVCRGVMGSTADRLLAVGHSSGAALAAGALHVLTPPPMEGAA
jgi:hypothetical protein